MNLIANWKRIALESYSMWSMYLGLLYLAVPEFLFLALSIDTDPRLWWTAGFVQILAGVMGRLVEQASSPMFKPIWFGFHGLLFLWIILGG